jgi:hypothetical protein
MSSEVYQTIQELGQTKTSAPAENGQKEFNKEQYVARKKAERDEVFSMLDLAVEKVQQNPHELKTCLDTMARFKNYSLSNALLIYAQNPSATSLGDFEAWKRRGQSIKQGQSAIAILEPGDEYTREDGSIGVSINIRKVFDERQTTARHIEPRHPEAIELLQALIKNPPAPIKVYETMPAKDLRALYDNDIKEIQVVEGLGVGALFKELTTEIAHAHLAKMDSGYTRKANIDTANLSAYVLAKRFGVREAQVMPEVSADLQDYSLADIKSELGRIREVSKTISGHIDKTLDKSRSKDGSHKTSERGGRDGR